MQVTLVEDSRPAPRYFGWSASPGVYTTTANGNSNPQFKNSIYATFQAIITGTGAVSATVTIQVSNLDTDFTGATSTWCNTPLGTITLSGTNSYSDGFTSNAAWKYCRAVVSAIAGTGATVSIAMGT